MTSIWFVMWRLGLAMFRPAGETATIPSHDPPDAPDARKGTQ